MEKIIVSVSPIAPSQKIHIYSDMLDIIPLTYGVKTNELASAVSMAAAKYKINEILIAGAKEYALGIKDQIGEKIESCFGYNNNIVIELMETKGEKK